ncbi:SDR family oxidoreductase [Bacillus solimangrovi]|uniref:Short-chain dehydrogenase n=1 Tax=Bacillus solimangrovi TaxID=1305675 RepID=A0A1E5LHM1_9BACI|nr:SDR family oxidoreductase [Bacillus solimangrovi]OEH93558.1 short-chain dehydrogenase [Bacillus solimangrovi]
MKALKGKIAVVTGATRGAGRGIAMMLGEAGATVYVTGRSTRGNLSAMGRKETIEETAELVSSQGGIGIPVRVDHTCEEDVKELFEKVKKEQNGQLDILVNDVWGGDPLTEWETPFWNHNLDNGLLMQKNAVQSHIITSHYGVPLMVKNKKGLVIEITDGVDYQYRGNLYYSLAKISAIHLAEAMSQDLSPYNITALAVSPGFLRSEAMLDYFGVSEANWQEGAKKDPHFIASETPFFLGRAIAALSSDPNVHEKTGQALSSWGLCREYGFTDIDGRKPDWGKHFEENVLKKM